MSRYHHVISRFEFITGSKGVFHAEPGEVLALFQAFIGPDVKPYPEEL